jgi:hypothetical protein
MTAHQLLGSDRHRDLRVRTERGAALGDAVMTGLVVPAEFRRVQDEYPILFRMNQERTDFVALALFGFENGENLFLEGDRWDARYRPLALAIQPFLIGHAAPDSDVRQVHVDTASPRISGDGEGIRVFDGDGRPTPYLEEVAGLLGELDAGYRESAAFFAALRQHDLLEPFTLEIELDDGSTNRLVGYHAIDEQKLAALEPDALGALHGEGHLMPIFMAVASLGRIAELVARKNQRNADG